MPPLTGYNNNVRHRGRIFHIQTEDSGAVSPRIMTHLFADGGRIVKSTRTDYAEYVGTAEMSEVVRSLMREQHKAMFVALRSGELDTIIGFDEDEPPSTLATESIARRKASELLGEGVPSSRTIEGEAISHTLPPSTDKPYASPRPAAIFAPPSRSVGIFGSVNVDERSLDDAILSYLAEEPTPD